jgi:hypothetical protein
VKVLLSVTQERSKKALFFDEAVVIIEFSDHNISNRLVTDEN